MRKVHILEALMCVPEHTVTLAYNDRNGLQHVTGKIEEVGLSLLGFKTKSEYLNIKLDDVQGIEVIFA